MARGTATYYLALPCAVCGCYPGVSAQPDSPVRVYHEKRRPLMANLDWSQCPAVESVADRRSGEWVFPPPAASTRRRSRLARLVRLDADPL